MPNEMLSGVSTFNGMRVIQSLYLTQNGTPYTVKRTWRERLFSRPWRPLVRTRTVTPQIPSQTALMLDEHTFLMHPETFLKLKHVLAEGETIINRTNSRNPLERTPYGT